MAVPYYEQLAAQGRERVADAEASLQRIHDRRVNGQYVDNSERAIATMIIRELPKMREAVERYAETARKLRHEIESERNTTTGEKGWRLIPSST